MMCRTLRGLVMACGMAAVLVGSPAESHAFLCNWLHGLFHPRTTFRPLLNCCPAPACDPCAPQVVQYAPQTCYRPQVVNVPVTAFRPACSVDPCTGCPVTTMRPVTTFVRQVQYVPYTSYRPVCAPACPTACPSPVTAGFAATPNCCTPAATTPGAVIQPAPITSAPAVIQSGPVVQPGNVIPATPADPATQVPTLNGAAPPATYYQNSAPLSSGALQPLPGAGLEGHSPASPLKIEPEDRTTRRPREDGWRAQHAVLNAHTAARVVPAVQSALSPVSHDQPAASSDDGGWRAGRR